MKSFLKNYGQTIILIVAIIIGAIAGLLLGEKAQVLSPFGDIFLNMMFVIIVPLIFLTISTSISKISEPRRMGKILWTILLTFILTSLVSVVIGIVVAYPTKLVSPQDTEALKSTFSEESENTSDDKTILQRTADVLTVNDFSKLLSKDNIVAIIVAAIIFGCAMKMSGEKAKPVQEFLISLTDVVMSFLNIVMYYAPIGLGCYFAVLTGTFGSSIAVGYLKTFLVYLLACAICYFGVYSLYAFIAGGKDGLKRFWSAVIPATLAALATCSSSASIPVNLKAAKNIGVSDDIAETLIPLGTSFHKDGSIIGSVFKAMFLVCLFGTNVYTLEGIMQILLISIVATLFVTAVPIGGGTISETMIITMLGYPLASLPILTTIATIIDAPATVLNVAGDTCSSMLAARIIDGKDWMNKAKETKKEKIVV